MTPEVLRSLDTPARMETEPSALDSEWDAVFSWSDGQRLWNVGCG